MPIVSRPSAMNALRSTFPGMLFEMTHPSPAAHDIAPRAAVVAKTMGSAMRPAGGGGLPGYFIVCRSRLNTATTRRM